MPDGRTVALTDEDLEHLPLATRRTIEVLGFVPGRDIAPISYSRPYYVGPGGPEADRSYVLLVEALARRAVRRHRTQSDRDPCHPIQSPQVVPLIARRMSHRPL